MSPDDPSRAAGGVCRRYPRGLSGLCAAAAILLAGAAVGASAADDDVFGAPPAPMTMALRAGAPRTNGLLRLLTVEERVGVGRSNELVRAPLFLHAGECAAPDALALYAAEDVRCERPLPWQADDIRRDATGAVSRLHLYFEADLAPWQRRQFLLYARTHGAPAMPAVPMEVRDGRVTLRGADLAVTFLADGPRAGGIVALESAAGAVAIPSGVLGPRVTLRRQDVELRTMRETPVSYAEPASMEVRALRYGTGPLFAKWVVRIGPPGVPDAAEYTYRLPRRGGLLIQTARFLPEEPDSLQVVGTTGGDLLHGRLVLGRDAAGLRVVDVPAGLRRLLRRASGHQNQALVHAASGVSLLAIPYVQSGASAIVLGADGTVAFAGPRTFTRHEDGDSGSIRAFWCETRYVFGRAVTVDALWLASLPHMQTLTAIVDEPGIGPVDLTLELAALAPSFRKITNWGRGWQQTAAIAYIERNEGEWRRILAGVAAGRAGDRSDETSVDHWLPGWARVGPGETPRRPSGWKIDYGRMDPYHIGFAAGSMPAFAATLAPSERLDRICLAVARASRLTNGSVDGYGMPYLNCFSTAFNMQAGSVLFGLHSGRAMDDPGLSQFYRDVTRQNGVLAIYGRGQRAYTSALRGAGQSDLLYEAISDFWLRTAELHTGEDLWLHPAVYGRYTDAIDVCADLCHRAPGATDIASWPRANFFRTQTHDHRWEAWDAAPYVGLFRVAGDPVPPGLTEAAYFVRHRVGRHVNWSELFNHFHAAVNLNAARQRYQPLVAPPLPAGVTVAAARPGRRVTWEPAAGAATYRIYRSEQEGGPWTLLNSPYVVGRARETLTVCSYEDARGAAAHVYHVTALDARGIESRWFSDEPVPQPGGARWSEGP